MAGTTIFTLSANTYSDLGAAPLQIQALGGNISVIVADAKPADKAVGTVILSGDIETIPQSDTGSHVWGYALIAGALASVTPAPATSGGSGGGGATAAFVTGQYKVTASPVAISGSVPLVNGVVVTAKAANAAPVLLGGSGVTTTYDGTGTGYALAPGASVSIPVSNLNLVYAIGTANDVISWVGN